MGVLGGGRDGGRLDAHMMQWKVSGRISRQVEAFRLKLELFKACDFQERM
jgi:hypothetical protein